MTIRNWQTRASFVAIAIVALSIASLGIATSSGATVPARWQPRDAESALATAVWSDHRIVAGATCLGLDPLDRRRPGSTTFSCRMHVWRRPARVPLARWNEMAAAFRKRDQQRIYALLGVSASASEAEVEAAARRWGLEKTQPVASGLKVVAPTRWTPIRAAIGVTVFDRSAAARSQVLNAIPAVEVYYVDHSTYAGMTLAALRRIDPNINSRLVVVRASREAYCVELTAATTIWSQVGPRGMPSFGHCRR